MADFYVTHCHPPISPLFPYTTLFRSHQAARDLRDPAPDRGQTDAAARLARAPLLHVAPQRCGREVRGERLRAHRRDRKSTRLNSSHVEISYAVFCLKKKKKTEGRAHN